MAVFKLVDREGNCNCEGCVRKIKNYVKSINGVESVVVNRIQDKNGNWEITIIAKGSFDPEKVILGVEIKIKKKDVIELVPRRTIKNGKVNEAKPIKVKLPVAKNPKKLSANYHGAKDPSAQVAKITKDLPLENDGIIVEPSGKKLDELASNNLRKAHKLKDLVNECEDLKARLDAARARQNELGKQKRDILNHDGSSVLYIGEAKKEDESEVLYGKFARQEMKLDDFVREYKRLQIGKYEQMKPSLTI